jgi:hypothetical protein
LSEIEGQALLRSRQSDLKGTDARRHGVMRPGVVALLAASALLAAVGPAPAAATMTVGQVALGNPTLATCTTPTSTDFLQPTSITVAGFFVKEAGTITSWSTNASLGPNQLYTMKIFRKVDDPATYRVVGHDGPRMLTPGVINTFSSNVQAEPGDILGFNESGGSNACTWFVPGDMVLARSGSLSDGNSGSFSTQSDRRLNISAVLAPSNSFTITVASRNRSNGTLTLAVNVSNPGFVSLTGKGVVAAGGGRKASGKQTTQAGPVELRIRAKGKNQRALAKSGKVIVKPKITFAPFNGDAATQTTKVKLRKKRGGG